MTTEKHPFETLYTNWRGETRLRKLEPINVRFGATAWHPEPQWLMLARDLETDEHKEFALKDMAAPIEKQSTVVDEKRVAEIRERLGKATPGPWCAWDHAGWAQPYISVVTEDDRNIIFPGKATKESDGKIIGEVWGTRGKAEIELANADFIAHAPDDITYLLARVKTLEAERDKALEDGNVDSNELAAAWATNAQRDARLVRAGIEMAAVKIDDYRMKPFTWNGIKQGIRALAADDAAIAAKIGEVG
jgi:hypothetical protein